MFKQAKRVKFKASLSVVNGEIKGLIIGDDEFVDTLRDTFNSTFREKDDIEYNSKTKCWVDDIKPKKPIRHK